MSASAIIAASGARIASRQEPRESPSRSTHDFGGLLAERWSQRSAAMCLTPDRMGAGTGNIPTAVTFAAGGLFGEAVTGGPAAASVDLASAPDTAAPVCDTDAAVPCEASAQSTGSEPSPNRLASKQPTQVGTLPTKIAAVIDPYHGALTRAGSGGKGRAQADTSGAPITMTSTVLQASRTDIAASKIAAARDQTPLEAAMSQTRAISPPADRQQTARAQQIGQLLPVNVLLQAEGPRLRLAARIGSKLDQARTEFAASADQLVSHDGMQLIESVVDGKIHSGRRRS